MASTKLPKKVKAAAPVDDWEEQAAPEASGADDWEEQAENPSNPSIRRARSKLESAHAGAAQAVTRGYAPRIVGYLANKLGGTYKDVLTGEEKEKVPYLEARDKTYREINEAESDNPWTFRGAHVAASLADPLNRRAMKLSGGTPMGSAAVAGAEGFLYSPGDEEGQESGLQLGKRLSAAGLSALAAGTISKGFDVAGAGGRAYLMKRAMNKPFFSKKLGETVEEAGEQLGDNYISPRAKAVRNVLKNKEVKIRPDALEDADEPGLMAALAKRTKKSQKEEAHRASGGLAPKAPAEAGDEFASLRGDVAERVRRKLEKKAYKQRSAFTTPEVAKSAEGKVKAASVLRDERNRVAPELADNFAEQKYALDILDDVRKGSASPQTMMSTKGDMASKLRDLDHMAGTNMSRTGQDLRTANYLAGSGGIADEIPIYLRGPVRQGANVLAAMGVPAAKYQEGLASLPAGAQGTRLSPAAIKLLIEEIMSKPGGGEQ